MKWYVLKVRPRHEKAIAERLSDKYEVFLPLISKYNQWSDRIKRVDSPLFNGYLFIRTSLSEKYYILSEKGIQSFVQFGDKPAEIRDDEIESIKLMLKDASTIKVDDGYSFSRGETVKIIKGVFAGINGKVVYLKNQARLYISIDQLGKIISIEIDAESLEKT